MGHSWGDIFSGADEERSKRRDREYNLYKALKKIPLSRFTVEELGGLITLLSPPHNGYGIMKSELVMLEKALRRINGNKKKEKNPKK